MSSRKLKKPTKKNIALIAAIIISAILIGWKYFNYNQDAQNIRRQIIAASIKSKSTKDKIQLDLSPFTDKKIEKICIQNQYMTEKSFIELTTRDAPNFQEISRGEFILWLYFYTEPPLQIYIKRGNVAPPTGGNLCKYSSEIFFKKEVISFN